MNRREKIFVMSLLYEEINKTRDRDKTNEALRITRAYIDETY